MWRLLSQRLAARPCYPKSFETTFAADNARPDMKLGIKLRIFDILLSGKSFSDDKNKAETLLQDFSLFCYFACWKKTLVT